MDSPLFSVIVPVYNNERNLERCIDSILTQSFRDFELIIVDDGSTDRTPQICDFFAVQDSRVRVIHRKINGGVVMARNDGLFQAFGKYVYYVDGDDWIARELLEAASVELSKEGAPDIFVFGHVKVQESGKYVKCDFKIQKGLYDKKRLEKDVFPSMICRVERTIRSGIDSGALWDKVIRRDLLKEHYCKNAKLFRGEDSVCAWECMYCAEKIYFSDLGLYFYDCTSVTSSKKQYHLDLYENNKAAAAYLRLHLHAEKDFRIERQINAFEYRGAIEAIHQEINFHHSIINATRLLKVKMQRKGELQKYSFRGLPFREYPFIMLLNLRCAYILTLWTVICYCFFDIRNMMKKFVQRFWSKIC